MTWTYTFHRWPTEAEYLAALAALGWAEAPPAGVVLDVPGTLYEPVEQPPDWTLETPLAPPVALPGWHVNVAWMGIDMPAEFAAALIPEPRNPRRRFAQ